MLHNSFGVYHCSTCVLIGCCFISFVWTNNLWVHFCRLLEALHVTNSVLADVGKKKEDQCVHLKPMCKVSLLV